MRAFPSIWDPDSEFFPKLKFKNAYLNKKKKKGSDWARLTPGSLHQGRRWNRANARAAWVTLKNHGFWLLGGGGKAVGEEKQNREKKSFRVDWLCSGDSSL